MIPIPFLSLLLSCRAPSFLAPYASVEVDNRLHIKYTCATASGLGVLLKVQSQARPDIHRGVLFKMRKLGQSSDLRARP